MPGRSNFSSTRQPGWWVNSEYCVQDRSGPTTDFIPAEEKIQKILKLLNATSLCMPENKSVFVPFWKILQLFWETEKHMDAHLIFQTMDNDTLFTFTGKIREKKCALKPVWIHLQPKITLSQGPSLALLSSGPLGTFDLCACQRSNTPNSPFST